MEEKLEQESSDIIKVVLFGPESTGKTTLSQQLARHYNTVWVPEYAREYLQHKWNNERKTCEPHDLLPIAEGQMRLENELTKKASNVLICDTDLLETKVYSEAYYLGYCDENLEKYALLNEYHLYFLTYIDVPWEEDDLRDKPNEREKMFDYFKGTLDKYDRKYVILKGDKKTRLKTAIHHIDKLLKMIDFTEKDLKQLQDKGISKDKVLQQIETFKEGIPFVDLQKAAVVGEGIVRVDNENELIAHFENNIEEKTILKFVPASGAASRMFKAMFNFVEAYDPSNEALDAYLERTGDKAVKQFVEGMENFSFYNDLLSKIEGSYSNEGEKVHAFVKTMLAENGLNFGFYPKGLLPFHRCKKGSATPFKEHLKEGALYAKTNGKANLHFTISPQHDTMFKEEESISVPRISQKTDTEFKVSYSYQKPSTDTLAVTMDNTPFRNDDGSILFRPGGHGALIENLNEQDADLVFIKNIDNVVIDENLEAVGNSKKVLGGLLLRIQEKSFKYAESLEQNPSPEMIGEIASFAINELNIVLPEDFESMDSSDKIGLLKEKLNRPIRICGMVKNEGEPGGGPFYIKDTEGNISLQIIESAQIDSSNSAQISILKNSTHFNPVDIVCGLKNHKGEKFDLMKFIDHKQAFITGKTQNGKELKALELPGLWNGAMAFWNTIFVEVPLVTFNPVKTVNDLLKPSHQS
ncbi:DUF4301 family protein [Croceivirga thetidis]|uniref:DUF4301 family protein n=1 Tax=Croceivirga thetidis TaxID=2721623 RepID=A0ABX1GNN7_9FLAO|nr:DUF4301 family protein [Croceivirga thetidis]NKI31538.1 DUF4301 family protein [Croceivirga thetidis]